MKVRDNLDLNPAGLITVRPESPIGDATQLMADNGIGIVVVLKADGTVAGVLSERDIVSALAKIEFDIIDACVGDLMTEGVVAISPEGSLVDAVLAMNGHGIRHLIVVDDNRPVGVMSIRDVLRIFANLLLDDQSGGDEQFTTNLARALAAA